MTRYVRGCSIYKPKARSRRTDPYLVAWTDASGDRHTKSTSTDIRIAIQVANEIAMRKDAAVHGLIDARADRYAAANVKPINDHIDTFEKYLIAKGDTEAYAKETAAIVRRVMTEAKANHIPDLVPGDIQTAIKNMPRLRVADITLSNRSLDKAVRACKNFGKYLKRNHLSAHHPLEDLTHYDPKADRRRIRRAIDVEDVLNLIDAAEQGPTRAGMSSADRAMLYRVATATGLRFGSLMSMTRESFIVNTPAPFVRVVARFVKSRKAREIPLRADLVDLLRPWLAGKKQGERVWHLSRGVRFMDAFRADLKAAGIAYQDEAGHFFDFHAQRNQFITAIVRSAGLKVAQDLAGHSTPALTADYARMNFSDYSKALEGLPPMKKRIKREGGVA